MYHLYQQAVYVPSLPTSSLCTISTNKQFMYHLYQQAVYVPSLQTNLDDLKNRITTAVNSVTQDILLRVWNEFSYRLDVTCAIGGGTLNIYKLHCEYN